MKQKKALWWLGGIALVLAAAMILGGLFPGARAEGLIAAPEYPEMVPYPNNAINSNDNQAEYNRWNTCIRQQYDQPDGYADGLDSFFTRSIPLFLAGEDENTVCSPLNIYMALAMLAETTGGESQDQVLSLLGSRDLDTLRTQAGHVWNAHYRADGASASLLANSLWLDNGYTFDPAAVSRLAENYYTSVYQGDMGSAAMNSAIQTWLNEQTRGLLEDAVSDIQVPEGTALALTSTVYFQARWLHLFQASNNTEGLFHSPGGDLSCTFMNQTQTYGPYYYGQDYGAVRLNLDQSGSMWLILPDEGLGVRDILESGHALNAILTEEGGTHSQTKVHLSLPKFDISANLDLKNSLTALGLGDLFDPDRADFTSILPDAAGICLEKVSHAARVAIDEEGVTAAA